MKLSQLKQQIEELDAKATGGPWVTGSIPWKVWANGGRNTVCDVKSVDDEIPIGSGLALSESMASNRDFIALSRTAMPDSFAASWWRKRRLLRFIAPLMTRKANPMTRWPRLTARRWT